MGDTSHSLRTWLASDGEMAVRLRTHNWAATSIGTVEQWPAPLRAAVRLCLDTGFPTCVYAGPELLLIYNDAFIDALGAAKHPRALGRPAREVWADVWAQIAPDFEQVLGRMTLSHQDWRFVLERHGQKQETFWTYTFSPIRGDDDSGTVAGIYSVATETTGRKRAEADLVTFRLLAEYSNDAQFLIDEHGRLRWVNRLAAERLGYTPDEMLAMSVQQWNALVPTETFEAYFGRARATRVAPFESVHRRKDGATFPVEITPTVVELPDGARLLAAARDITERKQAEEALRESEERFRVLVESWAQAVWEADASGAMVGDSPSWRAYTGQSLDDWRGRGWLDAVHPDDREGVDRQWRDAVEAGRAISAEFRLRSKACGQWRWTNLRAAPLTNADGSLRKWVGMNIDVTERKHAEQTLKRTDRAKTEFLAMLAHELRNPLAPLANAVALIERSPEDLPRTQAGLGIMRRQIGHLSRLVGDLLEISRIEHGKIELRIESIVLSQALGAAIETVQPMIEQRQQRLAVVLPSVTLRIAADAARITQVVTNLLHNASKFTPLKGALELAVEEHEDEVAIIVRDEGRGITSEALPHIFEVFEQGATQSLDRSEGGLGIGLALVERLVRMHGGRVWATSGGNGQGAVFNVLLPRVAHRAAASS